MPKISLCQRSCWTVAIAGSLLFAQGCTKAPQFQHDQVAEIELQVESSQPAIHQALLAAFGTPDAPQVPPGLEALLDHSRLQAAAGPVASHTPGETTGLYRRHCATCHGITGHGSGPAALYQWPYPRDFRQAVYKYKSTYRDSPPLGEDLKSVLQHGIPGTAMPAFRLLADHEIDSLVQYVIYLSLRGKVEADLLQRASQNASDSKSTEQWQAILENEILPTLAESWSQSKENLVPAIDQLPKHDSTDWQSMVQAGKQLFHDAQRANCVKCHGQAGQNPGSLTEYDLWNQRVVDFNNNRQKIASLHQRLQEQHANTPPERQNLLQQQLDSFAGQLAARRRVAQQLLPPRMAQPRQLSRGQLRGTHTPEALFRRIQQGIAGTPMPAIGQTNAQRTSVFDDQEIWQLVAYVMQLTELASPASDEPLPVAATHPN